MEKVGRKRKVRWKRVFGMLFILRHMVHMPLMKPLRDQQFDLLAQQFRFRIAKLVEQERVYQYDTALLVRHHNPHGSIIEQRIKPDPGNFIHSWNL